MSINPAPYNKVSFAQTRDSVPMIQWMDFPRAVMARADAPCNSRKDLMDLARANPCELNFGSGGIGGVPHLAMALHNTSYDLKLLHVHDKGSADAAKELFGAPIDLTCDAIGVGPSPTMAGKLRAPVVPAEARHATATALMVAS